MDEGTFHVDQNRDKELDKSLSQYNLNYQFDQEDPRDKKYNQLLKNPILGSALPSSIDLRSKICLVLDQGRLGSCVSNAVAYQLRWLTKKQNKDAKGIDTSRLFTYYNGRKLGGYPLDKDTGITLRQGFKSISNFGGLHEELWPYTISKFDTEPPTECYKTAEQNKKITYLKVGQKLNEMKKCLKDGYLVTFGVNLYESFMTTTVARTGVVPMPKPSERKVGGHAMTLCGYDDTITSFLVCNSWGSNWGIDGFCYIPYDYLLDSKLASDFWTVYSYKFNGVVAA